MERNDAIEILGAELAARAAEISKEWGEQEAELWRDQHPGKDLPEWTMGQYSGNLDEFSQPTIDELSNFGAEVAAGTMTSGEAVEIVTAQRREAADLLIDLAAREAWNAAAEVTN